MWTNLTSAFRLALQPQRYTSLSNSHRFNTWKGLRCISSSSQEIDNQSLTGNVLQQTSHHPKPKNKSQIPPKSKLTKLKELATKKLTKRERKQVSFELKKRGVKYNEIANSRTPGENPHLPPDDFSNKVTAFSRMRFPDRILELMTKTNEEGDLTLERAKEGTIALRRMKSELCGKALVIWCELLIEEPQEEAIPPFVREACRLGQMHMAEAVLQTVESEKLVAQLLQDMVIGYLAAGDYPQVLSYLQKIRDGVFMELFEVDPVVARNIVQEFMKEADKESLLRALELLEEIGALANPETAQAIASYYIKTVDFIKGAVSMITLPEPLTTIPGAEGDTPPEVAFIGRSNVGKSSLINYVSCRKNLAYTSKTPGKTSEFNYFLAQGGERVDKKDAGEGVSPVTPVDAAGDRKTRVIPNYQHKFYLVDLPGVGFAQVTKSLRQDWINLLADYTTQRESLRAIFHLIDSRHGALEADKECFDLLLHLPERVQYVVVLTKLDKVKGSKSQEEVIASVREELDKRMTSFGVKREVPIIKTSAEARQGAESVWYHIVRNAIRDSNRPQSPQQQ